MHLLSFCAYRRLGEFDPTSFNGLRLEWLAITLACFYMLIVAILLLNLLIAFMGDSYSTVKGRGLAQWKLEQARIITEMQVRRSRLR